MTKVPILRGGSYGDGTFGFKTAIPPNNVMVLADDSDVRKRSFNSQWNNIQKIALIGAAKGIFVQKSGRYRQQYSSNTGGTNIIYRSCYAYNGWFLTPAIVPTGLPYTPMWEERLYDPASKTFNDDSVYSTASSTSYSGARCSFAAAGNGLYPDNCLLVTSWSNNPFDLATPQQGGYWNQNVNTNQQANSAPGWPSYPATPSSPDRPSDLIQQVAFIIYDIDVEGAI